jgi:OOP family OmpA-OmpF porin
MAPTVEHLLTTSKLGALSLSHNLEGIVMNGFVRFIALVSVFSAITNVAVAEERPGPTGSLGVGAFIFDDVRGLENDSLLYINGGYRFDNPFGIEVGYIGTTGETLTGLEADINNWHINGIMNYDIGSLTPFISIGAGQGSLNIAGTETDETLFNFGIGGKLFYYNSAAIRMELKYFRGSDSDANDLAFLVGLHHSFGARKEARQSQIAYQTRDTDGDGVPDPRDRCQGTATGLNVDSTGCAPDSDEDGVPDQNDRCLDTTNRRARIDTDGCYVVLSETVRVELKVQFDTDSSMTRPEHRSEVQKVVNFMHEYPGTRVTIEGHTDSDGDAVYNRHLSQRRAQAPPVTDTGRKRRGLRGFHSDVSQRLRPGA